MPGNYAPNVGEADPCAFKLVTMMKTLEDVEKFVHIFHVKPYTIVLNGTNNFISIFFTLNLYFSWATSLSEFYRVGDEIYKCEFQHRLVCVYFRHFIKFPSYFPFLYFISKILNCFNNEGIQIYFHAVYIYTLHARKFKQIINEHPHSFCFPGYNVHIVDRLFIKLGSQSFFQHFSKARQMSEGRTKIMRDRISESLKFFIGLLPLLVGLDDFRNIRVRAEPQCDTSL